MVLSSRPLRSSRDYTSENQKAFANAHRGSSTSKTSSTRVTRSANPTDLINITSPSTQSSKRPNHDRPRSRAGRKRRLLEIDENSRSFAQQLFSYANGSQSQQTETVEDKVIFREGNCYPKVSDVSNSNENSKIREPAFLGKPKQVHEKRSLRSRHERLKPKSDLAKYFPNYEEIIRDAPVDDRSLTIDTSIYIIDEPFHVTKRSPKHYRKVSTDRPAEAVQARNTISLPFRTLTQYNGAQIVDFSSFDRVNHNRTDPLDDSVYLKSHQRAERREKQLRNIEKEKGMHEKLQLERLLDGLQGSDWLRVMGISGITASERKEFEPKRDYFMQEVQSLIDKFMAWKEEEKRLRYSNENDVHAKIRRSPSEAEFEAHENVEDVSIDETASTDLDVWASKQLQEEARSASIIRTPNRQDITSLQSGSSITKPFTSFYAKTYLRTAALGKIRQGRNATAFGHSIPECAIREFSLPEGYLTKDVLRANARKRRRLRREALDGRDDTQT